MAQLVVSAIGAAVGFAIGGPVGAQWGWMAGSMTGALLGVGQQDVQGPRLSDLKVQASTYGQPIPIVYGTARLAGNVIWSSDMIESSHSESAGGKGGGPEVTTYSYAVHCAVALCEGPIFGIRRIWADGKLIYDRSVGAKITGSSKNIRIYPGSETQMPDPLIEAYLGAGKAPAHRGVGYVVFENFQLADYGNRIPNFTFEVVATGTGVMPAAKSYGLGNIALIDSVTGYLWTARWASGKARVEVYDVLSQTLIRQIDLDNAVMNSSPTGITINADARRVWIVSGEKKAVCLSADNGSVQRSFVITDNIFIFIGTTVYVPVSSSLWTFSGTGIVISGVANSELDGTVLKSIPTPDYVFQAAYFALPWNSSPIVVACGYGRWMRIYNAATIAPIVTITAPVWTGTPLEHSFALDPDRRVIWWACGLQGIQKVRLDNYSVTHHFSSLNVNSVVYFEGKLFLNQGNTWKVYNPDTFAEIETLGAYPDPGTWPINPIPLKSRELIIYGGSGGIKALPMSARVGASAVGLGNVVSNLCARGGLTAGDVDVSTLTDQVGGFVVTQPATVRANLEALAGPYFFDGIESDAKLKFVKRGGAAVADIPTDEMAAHAFGSAVPPIMEITRLDETQLPMEVNLSYADPAFDHQVGTQYARRLTGRSLGVVNVQAPLALSATEAKRIADAMLFNAWSERETVSFSTSRKYARLEPSDVITVSLDGVTRRLRLTDKEEEAAGLIKFSAVTESSAAYAQTSAGVGQDFVPQSLDGTPATRFELLDMPVLLDAEDASAGFYIAACGYDVGWSGCIVYRSVDGGVTWADFMTITKSATMGDSLDVLGDFSSGNIFDESNSVTVALMADQTLASQSEALVLAGVNTALLGSEVIGFKNAELVSTGVYLLSGLLRGLAGTEWAIGSHAVGERFVLMTSDTISRADTGSNDLNLERLYKAVTFGSTLSSAHAKSFTNTGIGLKPYAPCEARAIQNTAGDFILRWVRRNRTFGAWRDYVDVPNTEAEERYDVEVCSTDGTVKRTLIGLTAPTFTYTTAMLIADFGFPLVNVDFRIYQISAVVGPGMPAVIEVRPDMSGASTRWRIQYTKVGSGSNAGLAEIKMFEVIGDPSACVGGTASCNKSSLSGNVPANAFDGNPSTIWNTSSFTAGDWIEYEFPAHVVIVQYSMQARPTFWADAPQDFTLQYYNGLTWVTVDTRSGLTWTASEIKTFTI